MNHSTKRRLQLTARFLTFAQADGKPKVLLIDIRDAEGTTVANHHVFNLTEGFKSANLKRFETVSFVASVDGDGSAHQRISLSRPTNVMKVHA
jgi:hypothetical protein